TLTEGGTYRLLVTARPPASTYQYAFEIWSVPPTVTTPITLDQVVSGSLTVPGQEIDYTFSGVAGQQIFFDSQVSPGFSASYNLYQPDGSNLFVSFFSSDIPTTVLTQTGTYRITLAGRPTPYQFEVWQVPATVSQPLPLDVPVAGSLQTPGLIV